MKRIISFFIIILCFFTLSFSALSCDKSQTEDGNTVFYGFVTTTEENSGLFVDIPNYGICQLPSYENGKEQDLTLSEGNFIKMEFAESTVEFLELYPVQIKTEVS